MHTLIVCLSCLPHGHEHKPPHLCSNLHTIRLHGVIVVYSQGSPEAEDRCGRILGLHLHPTDPDILFAADSSFGLLQINVSSRQVEILVTQGRINDEEVPFINFSNDLVALDNGSIFFTDSSKKNSSL